MKVKWFTNLSIAVRIGEISVEDRNAAEMSPARLLTREYLLWVSPKL